MERNVHNCGRGRRGGAVTLALVPQLVISSGLGAGPLHVATHKKARGHIGGTPGWVMSKADGRGSFLLGGLKWGWHSESRRRYKSRQMCASAQAQLSFPSRL